MSLPIKTIPAALALFCLLQASAGVRANPVAGPDPAAEDVLLANIARRAFDDPAAMLAELERRWPAQAGPGQPREAAWLFTRGRVLLADGRPDAADAIALRLMAREDGVDRGWLLRALVQEQAGKSAGALALRALQGLDKRCPAGAEVSAVREGGCDFRATLDALQLVRREQSGQGAFAAAEATSRRALALAKAGDDHYLMALSHSQLAVVLQAEDRLDDARAEIRAAIADASGDPVAMARARNAEAYIERRAGDMGATRSALEAALVLAEQADAQHLASQIRSNLVDAHMHLGELKMALATGQRALPVLQRFNDYSWLHNLRHNLAITHIKLHQFEAARQELARVDEIAFNPADLVARSRTLRELGDTWAEVGQYKEALAAYHAERDFSARANERNRAAALEELNRKYDSASKQRDLDLLARDGQLKDQQLANRRLAQQVGVAIGALLLLSLALIGVTLVRMRRAQARLTANQNLLRAQSERDPLTDLSNRRHFLAVMEQRAQGSNRFSGALMMIDIDHFKNVNDWHGHAAGDAVIVEVARRIRSAVREDDLVVRWGGEEFLVFAPELPGDDLALMAERVLRSIGAKEVDTPEGPLRITASIGFASFPLGSASAAGPVLRLYWEQAVNWVDMVLYKAKAEGRNRGVGITAVEAADAEALAAMLQDFDAACLNGQVKLRQLPGPQ